jgi:pimeloyl-ACP methyl ester carboxylesterase
MSPAQARAEIRALGTAQGFDAGLAATVHRHYAAEGTLDAPVTVAFGSRDRVLLRHQSRHVDQLPPGTRSVLLPGCGHLPMADDPPANVDVIRASASGAEQDPLRSRASRAAPTTAG